VFSVFPRPRDGNPWRVPSPIEDYALVGDLQSAALVAKDGSIDWLCLPRFDSPALFAALLGDERNGRWRIAPAGAVRALRRRYLPGTLLLETEIETADGAVRVLDGMPPRGREPDLVRVVRGVRGQVDMRMHLTLRFDYGRTVPWVRRTDDGIVAVAGPDAVLLHAGVPTRGEDMATLCDFTVGPGDEVAFVLTWFPSHEPRPRPVNGPAALADAESWWREWSRDCSQAGEFSAAVERSLITLKALTYAPTGGIVAAPTTSLPEQLGGVRNWDYRYCWLRDATLTLLALIEAGHVGEARAWRSWLLRAVAGSPEQMQIMYGIAGERRLDERVLEWLPGYEGAAPVRIGNAAAEQFQLDVYGEIMDALFEARCAGLEVDDDAWRVQRALLAFLETAWREPDEGIWEVRGPRRHFTHSKVMAWVAFDRAVRSAERFGLTGPVDRWRALRDEIHREVCERAWDKERGTFTQSYGARPLDAALLMLPLVGFLPPDDERVAGTVAAIERELLRDGFVLRYPTDEADDGLPPGEGAFLPCSFWLVEVYAAMGRRDDALALMRRLMELANDVGLIAEEYDPGARRQVGNFPQAFTHLALVSAAMSLAPEREGPTRRRRRDAEEAGR